ncbi:MAG TPA: PIN domain-containing protein [Tepidisphaeraceae bacterium]|jgi:uncharacterized protein YacL|nr:PIN domain-containing protein [Tepidisphaeraceae bacterium]
MVLSVLRALFVLLMAAIGWFYLSNQQSIGVNAWMVMPITLTVGVLLVCVDILSPRRKLAVFSGAILGLMVGVAIAYALSFVVKLIVDIIPVQTPLTDTQHKVLTDVLNVGVGMVCCYFAISFILQTRDDFRFIIPYVEFSRQQKGPRPLLLDTSSLIDGRISDVLATGILESQLIVPTFVVDELQALADSADKIKRSRGRRGLDILAKLRGDKGLNIKLFDASDSHGLDSGVDQKLIRLARELNARIVTTDYNLDKVAQVAGVNVVNMNEMAAAMKPVVLPGEKMKLRIVRTGEEPGQGVGYLDDGTMVVVEHARQRLNEEVEITVSRALQTSAGRMVFGKLNSEPAPDASAVPRRQRSESDAATAG